MKKDFKQFPGTENPENSTARGLRYGIVIAILFALALWAMPTIRYLP